MTTQTPTSIMLASGRYFDCFAPDPSAITLGMLARGLEVPRWNNQTTRPITIAEHSLRVGRIAAEIDPGARLWGLLHDAHEALVPWGDCLRPGKTDAMRDVERDVDEAIIEALSLRPLTARDVETVKTADALALYFEAMLWLPGAIDWAPRGWPETHRITGGGERPRPGRAELIERFMPLVAPRPGECWAAEVGGLL